MMSDKAYSHFKKNLPSVAQKIMDNADNQWLLDEFVDYPFIEKKFQIDDFSLIENKDSADKQIDLENSLRIVSALKDLPNYVLTNEKFWLWLNLEKFYKTAKSMMKINSFVTIRDHWMFGQGIRRGLMFGVLSRCYYRVQLTVDERKHDKYELTKWIIDNPERYRNLSWRSYSSEKHLVRGILAGEKMAVEEKGYEINGIYTIIAKHICRVGSVQLLDAIEEDDIKKIVYEKMIECYNS